MKTFPYNLIKEDGPLSLSLKIVYKLEYELKDIRC